MQDFRLTQNQSLRQEQTISAAQIQSLDVLMATVLELQTKINSELETNPVLEQEEPLAANSDENPANDYDVDEIDNSGSQDKSLLDSGKIEAEDLSDDDFSGIDLDISENGAMIARNQNFTYSVDEEKRDYFSAL